MEKDKKNYGKSILVVLLLLITMVALVFATYAWARYTSTASGNVTASIARWDVTLTSNSSKFVRQYQHVVTDKMAPGTEGEITIALNANDTDVNFDFDVALNNFSTMQKPAHVRFYTDADHQHEITGDGAAITGRVVVVGADGQHQSPTIQFGTRDGETFTPAAGTTPVALDPTSGNISIYWDWAYDYATYGGTVLDATHTNHTKLASDNAGYADAVAAYDAQDTQDAKDFNQVAVTDANGVAVTYANGETQYNAASKTMVVDFTLTATQVRPSPTTY